MNTILQQVFTATKVENKGFKSVGDAQDAIVLTDTLWLAKHRLRRKPVE